MKALGIVLVLGLLVAGGFYLFGDKINQAVDSAATEAPAATN